MDDLISRQAAIDAINNIMPTKEGFYEPSEVFCELMQLPSVQPDIIYCKDCKNCQIDGVFHAYWCDGRRVLKDHYCGYAERRTNEQTVSE